VLALAASECPKCFRTIAKSQNQKNNRQGRQDRQEESRYFLYFLAILAPLAVQKHGFAILLSNLLQHLDIADDPDTITANRFPLVLFCLRCFS